MPNTPNFDLEKPAHGATGWDVPINSNFDKIDAHEHFAGKRFIGVVDLAGSWNGSLPVGGPTGTNWSDIYWTAVEDPEGWLKVAPENSVLEVPAGVYVASLFVAFFNPETFGRYMRLVLGDFAAAGRAYQSYTLPAVAERPEFTLTTVMVITNPQVPQFINAEVFVQTTDDEDLSLREVTTLTVQQVGSL